MKEIGDKLRETREEMGISLDEAAEDLKLRPSQIENIEAGNLEAFKDIFYLKYFIRDYSKYLGLDHEEMIDEFNEYLFDYTSKISIDEIKKAKKKSDKKEDKKKISSPYTIDKKKLFSIPPIFVYIGIALLAILIIYFIISINNNKNEFKEDDTLINVVEGSVL